MHVELLERGLARLFSFIFLRGPRGYVPQGCGIDPLTPPPRAMLSVLQLLCPLAALVLLLLLLVALFLLLLLLSPLTFRRFSASVRQGVYGDFPGPHCVVEGGVERIAEVVASPQVGSLLRTRLEISRLLS